MFQETTLQGFQMPCWIPNVLLTNERTNSAWNINASPVTSSGFHFIIADKLPDKGRRHHTSVNISPRYVHIWNVTGNYSGANTILFTWISSIDSTSFLLFTSPIFTTEYFLWPLSSYCSFNPTNMSGTRTKIVLLIMLSIQNFFCTLSNFAIVCLPTW